MRKDEMRFYRSGTRGQEARLHEIKMKLNDRKRDEMRYNRMRRDMPLLDKT